MMNPLRPLICLLSCVLCALVGAAEVQEISPGLGYLRVHSVVQEREAIKEALHQPRPLVLDLRQTADERDAGETLRLELNSQPAKSPLYVLVSPTTPAPVADAVAASTTRLVTLGVKGAHPEPQVVVQQSADDDRKAYDALATGTALADLISGKVEKERYDEATLVQEFKGGNHDARPPAPGQTDGSSTASTGAASPSARLTDRVLQRAVHLHRALQVLKR